MHRLRIAQDDAADELLSSDPFALLAGMLLDQQFPMERAFAGPHLLAGRMHASSGRSGAPTQLDPAELLAADPDDVAAWMAGPPAVHRYHASMGGRLLALARTVVDDWGGDASRIWSDPGPGGAPLTGQLLRQRLEALPGFGRQKASIFVALLGKQLGVRPGGWREAAGAYADDGSYRSVADVRDADSLARVRETKKAAKAQKAAAAQQA